MSAEESLRAGRLDECLVQVQDQIRKNPAKAEHRIFLFQLQAILGQWEKAFSQLNVLADLDPGAVEMVQTYREALKCEILRSEVFTGQRTPLLFGEPEPWMAAVLHALQLGAKNQEREAEAMRAKALEDAPTTAGSIDGRPFAWVADADSRFGPMFEVIINGKYFWMPIRRLRSVRLEKPVDLRDLVWLPAYLTLESGSELPSLIPTRYPGSERSPDGQLRLARKTEWTQQGEATFLGSGQRILATDIDEFPLLDVREITFAASP